MDSFSTDAIMDMVPQIILTVPYLGQVDVTQYTVALGIFIVLTAVFWLVREIVIVRLHALSQKTSTNIDDTILGAVKGIRSWVYMLVAIFGASLFLSLPALLMKSVTAVVLFAVVWQCIEIILCFVGYGAQRFLEKDEDGDGVVDPNAATASHMVTLIARIALWALGGLFVLSNLGIEVTSLIAGLGIGGIAVAFALQGILSDLFASFSLYFDKPFRIGDFIIIGTDSGTVERIGIKTTRIRTLQGEELVVSNAELTSARVQNFKKMQRRRISSQFGITYETSHELVKQVPGVVERIFEATENVVLDRVHFTTFADSALVFDIVYYVQSPDYADYLDIQQKFNFELMDKFAELGIEFAYPTQTLFVKKVD